MSIIPHWINGRQVVGSPTLPVDNPWLGETVGEVSVGDAAVVDQAVQGCLQAGAAWAALPPVRRATILFRFRERLEHQSHHLASLISQEHGKLISDAQAALQRGLEVVEYACGIPHLLTGRYSDSVARNVDSYSLRQPVGVCVGITPFNFPAMVPLWMIPLALACGNTFILKPSERDPSAAILLASLWQEAGLPDGVFQVVQGDRVVVESLLTHPQVDAVSFVGSTPVAQTIYRTAAAQGKRVQALGGAKNPLVVMPDADLDQTVAALIGAAFGSAGERCMAITLAVAVGEIGDPLVARLIPRVQQIVLGQDMGPLVTREHRQRVIHYLEKGVQEGASLVVDGRQVSAPQAYPQGFWLGASLFDQVTAGMTIYQEEIFGPVLGVVRVPDLAAALSLVNQHPYGNGAAIFTRDGGAARQFVQQVHSGMVGVNVPIPVPMAWHTFGGWKGSRLGDLGMYGEDAIAFYTRQKTVTSRWPEVGSPVKQDFVMPVTPP